MPANMAHFASARAQWGSIFVARCGEASCTMSLFEFDIRASE
jgi:hypothetical protein